MIKKTPFHERLSELSQTDLWSHWSGFLSATRYDFSTKYEYFGVRNAAGLFDSSPMFKYSITGPDAEKFLAGVMARDIRTLAPGRAQYQVWVNDAGHVLEDGVVFRHSNTEFLLTAAEPNLDYFLAMAGRLNVSITDVSDEYGFLAVQGPHSRAILAELAPEVTELRYFGLTPAKIAGHPVSISRTGYSGDLGYELFVPPDQALALWDLLWTAGQLHRIVAIGFAALDLARLEAGFIMAGSDFVPAEHAIRADRRRSPYEIGLGWLVALDKPRHFNGKRALAAEKAKNAFRHCLVALDIDGNVPAEHALVYHRGKREVGHITAAAWSPTVKRNIALASMTRP